MEIRPIMSALLRSKTGAVLVALQVALTLAIVCNAAFIVMSRLDVADRPTGADDANVFEIAYAASREIEDRVAVAARDLEVLRALPGVVAATTINQIPLGQSGWGSGISPDPNKPEREIGIAVYQGDEQAVDALGLTLIEGRGFEPGEVSIADQRVSDREISEAVILTRAVAKQLFPGETSFVGKTTYMGGSGPDAKPMRVVGVVERLITPWAQSDGAEDSILVALRWLGGRSQYAVRAEPGQRSRVMRDAEKALTALRTDRVLLRNRTLPEIREIRYRAEKTGAGMLVAVSIALLVVTGSGIVGVASLWVNQRRKQIGVRRALGAGRIDILRYFVIENLLITTVGVALGAGLAIGLNQFLISKLELPRLPIAYLVGGVGALWALGVVAVLGPAWRAAAVPPAIATRSA